MTRSLLIPAALAVAVIAAATPALAVSIRHTNRAGGDPAADSAPRTATPAAPPADTSGAHYFDKVHESGNHG